MSNTLISLYDASGNRVSPSAGANKEFTIVGSDNNGAWTEKENGYEQEIEVAGMTKDMNGICGLAMKATDAQYEAASEAQIRVVDQNAGTVTVRVTNIPGPDIPCNIILFGKE